MLVAPRCAACEAPLDAPSTGPVCTPCWDAVRSITPPVCDGCGDPLPSWRTRKPADRCLRCGRPGRPVARGRAVGSYEGALRAIVHAFKYDGRRSLAVPLARLMTARGGDVIAGADLVVPVPLHRSRRRARGYNQAADLAAQLPLPCVGALRRTRPTPSQTGLPAGHRRRNVRGAFSPARRWPLVDRAARVRGRVVLLVDDVATTGATLDACARALLAMGAREVRALTVARVSSRR